MKKFKIQVVATKGTDQIVVKEYIKEVEDKIESLDLGKVRHFSPLDRETELNVWISEVDEKVNDEE